MESASDHVRNNRFFYWRRRASKVQKRAFALTSRGARNRREPVYGTLLVLVLVLAVFAIGRESGLFPRGTLVIQLDRNDVSLILNGDPVFTPPDENGRIVFEDMSTGEHEVIAAVEGHFPYAKTATIARDETTVVRPFFVRQSLSGFTMGPADPEFKLIERLFAVKHPGRVTSETGTVELILEPASVTATWVGTVADAPRYFCETTCRDIGVFRSPSGVRNAAFFPSRDDVAILASGDTVFALEIEPEGTQNFQPIWSGVAPDFRVASSTVLYVRDNDASLMLSLE